MTYGAVHRFFLRTIACSGVLTFSEAEKILNQSFPDEGRPSIEDLSKSINNIIRPFQQTIKIVIDEVTSEKKIVFLSLGFDDATKSQNVFSAQELDFFRILIEQIMTTESRQITFSQALHLVSQIKLSKTDAEKLLETWCRMYYLEKIGGNYALGIRAIHEFRDYLYNNMPDTIDECRLCKEIVFRGYNCPICAEAVHTRCLYLYLANIQKWPCCEADFSQAQLEILNSEGLSQTQGLERTRGTQVVNRSSAVEETAEISDDDFEETQMTYFPNSSQRNKRKRKRMISD